ncbi:hypothetical protein Ade02nite_36380 [Paractinoplanes deccanensis]|uniref:Lipoprotein n=1 Tax=Paractinoplanes deccanensis TaxID=113561 RepID=A0ABQ3Y4S1_9ACTN|nr:hypothetical protein [Actinoplanes deccanensis]GID74997.1 hypothetical protein Ade02nite_36380 [Actinoplanes deccanensis]
MTRLRTTFLAAAAPLALLCACAQPDGAGAATGSESPVASAPTQGEGANYLVVRTESSGGFVPPDRTVGGLPAVSVYADGRVITDGPVPAIYPGPALPNVQVTQISPEQVQQLTQQGLDAGVRNGTDFGRPNVADAPTTRVTVRGPEGTHTVAVEALRESQANDPMLTKPQREARSKLASYVDKLTGITGTTVAYEPKELAVLARPYTEQGNAEPKSPEVAWPGPALPGRYLNEAFKIGCLTVTGDQMDTVLAAAREANAMTPWTDGGKKYAITFRPLLPDESGCQTFAITKGSR